MKKCLASLLLVSLLLTALTACGKKAPGEISLPQADQVQGKAADLDFENAYMEFAVSLLQKTAAEKQGENMLISPLSIQLALAMTANGADGKTLQEMEHVLGQNIPLADLNMYLHSYLYNNETGLVHGKERELKLANSVWFRDQKDSLRVEEDFLQSVSDYYDADIYKRAFDSTTVKEINNWVDQNTDGMISKILDKIDSNSMMYLINAISFDAEWEDPYDEYAIRDGSFTTHSGEQQTVPMMHSEESVYIADNRAAGFVKPYKGGKFDFAVLVPYEGVSVYDYLYGLTAASLSQTLSEAEECKVFTQMPKFSYDFALTMNDVLKDMGMSTAFDPDAADLSKLGSSDMGNLYIGNVLHKTFIRVDGMGTQAGAVTVVEIPAEGAMEPENYKEVIVDRPFVYMILDSETNLPVFIGCVTEITE